MYNTLFMKYFYLLIFFCVLFIAMYNDVTEAIALKFIVGVQSLYLVMFIFQLINDKSRGNKTLDILIPRSKFAFEKIIKIPLYWIILPGLILQLTSSVFITIMANYLNQKYGTIKLPRNSKWNLNMYKWMFITATFALFVLIYSYCNDFFNTTSLNFSGAYKSFLLLLVFISLLLPSINTYNSYKLSRIIFSTTQ